MITKQKKSTNRFIIVQEVFPVYRKPLFDILSDKLNFKLLVSEESLGDITVFDQSEYVVRRGIIKNFFGGKFFWQTSLLNYGFSKNDIVVLSASPRNLTMMILLAKLKMQGIKTVLWGHYESANGTRLNHYIRMCLLKLASGILFYTDLEASRYKSTLSRDNNSQKILGLNNGLAIKEISNFRISYEKNINERNFNILFIGRLTKKTKLELLLRSISYCKSKDKIKLHVIGDGELREFFLKLANDLNVDKLVIWHGTKTCEQEISKIANNCALFIYPGDVGLSLIHCMSYGLPCLIHDNRKHHNPEADALFENTEAIYFKENDYIDLSLKIDKLLESEKIRVNQSFQNLKIVENKYNVEKMAQKFIEIYEFLAK